MQKQRAHEGYTLVELMVTVGIFTLAFTTIAAIFLGFTSAQSRATRAQRLLNEGNFLFESIVREIRISGVDYNCGAANYSISTKYLCLRGGDGNSVHIRVRDAIGQKNIEICKDTDPVPCAETADWSVLSSDEVIINDFAMRVYPPTTPDSASAGFDGTYHPMTVVSLNMEAGTGRARQEYQLQTAVSSRAYDF